MASSDLLWAIIIAAALLLGITVWLLRRRSSWYRVYLLKDFRNQNARPRAYWLSTRTKEGIEVADIWNHIYSFSSVNPKEKPIIEKPDLNAYSFMKMLFAVRGITGKKGDATWIFIRVPLMSADDEKNYEEATYESMMNSLPIEITGKLTKEEREKTLANLRAAVLNLGYLPKAATDPLLREEKVAYAAINADSANYFLQNMAKWQKLTAIAIPLLLGIVIFVVGLSTYLIYQAYAQAQQSTYTYQQQLVNEMNANNQYFYSILTSLNIYGVKPPLNFTTPSLPNGSLVPTVPTLPKIKTS